MKANLVFDSLEEFVAFILASSSILIKCEFKRVYENRVSDEVSFLGNINTVHIPGFVYSCIPLSHEKYAASSQTTEADFHVKNYMLNQVQIENETIFITFSDESQEPIVGIKNVRQYLIEHLPANFLLRIGWRTDYEDIAFSLRPTMKT